MHFWVPKPFNSFTTGPYPSMCVSMTWHAGWATLSLIHHPLYLWCGPGGGEAHSRVEKRGTAARERHNEEGRHRLEELAEGHLLTHCRPPVLPLPHGGSSSLVPRAAQNLWQGSGKRWARRGRWEANRVEVPWVQEIGRRWSETQSWPDFELMLWRWRVVSRDIAEQRSSGRVIAVVVEERLSLAHNLFDLMCQQETMGERRRCRGVKRVAPSQRARSALAAHVDGNGSAVNDLKSYGPRNIFLELMDLCDTLLQIYGPLCILL